MDDIFSPHHGGVYTPSRKPALNTNNLESMDKPKIYINIPVLLIGGLIIVFLMTKK